MSTRDTTRSSAREPASGVVYVHSSPSAVCPHVEWAIAGVLGSRTELSWSAQPAAPGQLRAEHAWSGEPGIGARLASALRAWPMLRFEITEDPSPGVDGERLCHVPDLGLWRATTGANGDILVSEHRLRSAMSRDGGSEPLRHRMDQLLGTAWDDALEPFRRAGDGAPVAWLHRVG